MKHFNIFKRISIAAMLVMGASQNTNAAISTGTYTVGATGTYTTLASALSDIGTMTGNITLSIQPGTYTGAGWQGQLPAFAGASATNRLSIEAANGAGTVIINNAGTSTANYIVQLNGTQYITLRNLTINNTSTTYGRVIEFVGTATNDSIVGCTLTNVSGSTTSNARALIYAVNGSGMTADVVQGCTLLNGAFGIYWYGNSATATSADNVFAGNTFTNNYNAYIYTNYMGNATIINNTCTASAISGAHNGIYMYYPQNGFTIKNNSVTTTATGVCYGIYSTYGNGTSANNELVASNNTVTLTGSSTTWGIAYYYYNKKVTTEFNTVNVTTGGGDVSSIYIYNYNENIKCNNNIANATENGSYYNYGLTVYYSNYSLTGAYCMINNNTITSNHNGSSYLYMTYINYNGYYAIGGVFQFNNNTVNGTHTNTSYYNYGPYVYYNGYGSSGFVSEIKNNTVLQVSYYYAYISYWYGNVKAVITDNNYTANFPGSGTAYGYKYGPAYYCEGVKARNNTYNINMSNAGYIYDYAMFNYNSGNGSLDTVENNTETVNLPNGGTFYNYVQYVNGYSAKNTLTVNATTGTIYNYPQYGYAGLIYKNKMKFTTTTGTIYGYYSYGGTSYSSTWLSNNIEMNSTSGTIYGCGGYSAGNDKLIGNVFVAKTGGTGSTYMFYEPTSYGTYAGTTMLYCNNTFHSNSTTNTNYLVYKAGGTSSSYNGKTYLYNNIFTRTNAGTTFPVYINDTTTWFSDYNLYYTPGTFTLQSTTTPAVQTTALQTWRATTGRDMNSLIYDPGYTNAAANDFHPDASNPNSWSVNGRGMHVAGDTLDADGVTRPKTRQLGVPDLGAYEFTPALSNIPPACVATPATPVASTNQYFTFGQDTVATIAWGSSAPTTATMRQYSGVQAPAPMPSLVGRGFEYLDLNTGSNVAYAHTPTIHYKDPWLGTISNETNTKIANSVNNGTWIGYNFTNSKMDSNLNKVSSTNPLDSTGKYTIVENARIGIRCVVVPTGVRASNITASSADVNWDAVFLPIGYNVLADNTPGSPSAAAAATASFASTNSFSITSLTEGTDYYIHVRSICGPKDTSGWTTIKIRTLITCHAPTVKITALTQYRAIAYWDTIETATKYEYAIQNTATPPPPFGTTIYTNQLFLPIQQGKEYYVFVRAYCSSIYPQSDWGMGQFITFPTAINGVKGSSIGLGAYPNPVTNTLHVELANEIDGDATLTVTDMTGKVMRSLVVTASKTDINMNGLSAGIYQLKYSDRSHVDVMKITKQ